jgi:hypothetical protein
LPSFFLLNRGKKIFAQEHNTPMEQYDGAIWQDNLPLLEHREIVGHAVRAAYLFAGATDLAAETDDPALREQLLQMLLRVWDNTNAATRLHHGRDWQRAEARGIHRRLRAAQPHGVSGDLRVDCAYPLGASAGAAAGRGAFLRCAGARPV